jgi:hypothetical protein
MMPAVEGDGVRAEIVSIGFELRGWAAVMTLDRLGRVVG